MNTFATRFCLLSLLAAVMLVVAAESRGSAREWRFKVFLDDRWIGYHNFRLTPRDDNSHILEVDASFDVKFLFLSAYRYRHRTTELWRHRCLQRIESSTNDNGKHFSVTGFARDNRFHLETGAGKAALADCVMSFAYWEPAIRDADRLLNAQTGEYVEVDVSRVGREQIVAGGERRDADRYRLSADDATIDLWYDAETDTWLALQSTTEAGRKLRYLMM